MDRRLRYCPNCQQNVRPTKKFSVGWFLVLGFLTFGLGAFIYLLYYACRSSPDCPICGTRVHGSPARDSSPPPPSRVVTPSVLQYCKSCGEPVTNPAASYCERCGALIN